MPLSTTWLINLFTITGALGAIFCEYTYRRYPDMNWFQNMYWIAPIQLYVGYAVYRAVIASHSLLDAFILWASSTMLARFFVSAVILGESISTTSYAAFLLIIIARVIQTFGR